MDVGMVMIGPTTLTGSTHQNLGENINNLQGYNNIMS